MYNWIGWYSKCLDFNFESINRTTMAESTFNLIFGRKKMSGWANVRDQWWIIIIIRQIVQYREILMPNVCVIQFIRLICLNFKIAFQTTCNIKLLVSNIQYVYCIFNCVALRHIYLEMKKKPNQRSQHELDFFFNRSRFKIESTMKIIKCWLRVFKLIPKKEFSSSGGGGGIENNNNNTKIPSTHSNSSRVV